MKMISKTMVLLFSWLISGGISAQCPTGLTRAYLNWDYLDYYYNSGNNVAPYGFNTGSYVSSSMEQLQHFAMGTTTVSFSTSMAGMAKGKNVRHTGNLSGYAGADVQFTPSGTGQTITINFGSEVNNASFVLYDVDAQAAMSFAAVNAANVPVTIQVTRQATSILTVTGSGTTAPAVSSSSTDAALNANNGSATVLVASPVKKLTITVTNSGTEAPFWLSGLYACVAGSFPVDYHKMASSRPFTGQPDYFLTTADNNAVYKVDPVTGKAWFLFAEPASTYVNSFAYDQINHVLYYTLDGTGSASTNKKLKKYDFNTETASIVLNDISASFNIPTFDQGLESAAAAFYDGCLYLGVEGGKFYNSFATRHTIIYKLRLDNAGVPLDAVQVFAAQAYDSTNGNSLHDWGDFLVKDGKIIDFNTARQGTSSYTYPKSSFIHFDMMTGTATTYTNPTTSLPYGGQAGMDWAGNLYSLRNGLQKYNMTGGLSSNLPITVVRGPAWRGNAGDASEPFKPKVDFGDAPSTFDPAGMDPAVHEMDSSIRLGSAFDTEWDIRGQTSLADMDNYDDGMPTVTVLDSSGIYVTEVSVFNNTGSNATLCAWLDWNGNGVFDAAEGITRTISSKNTQQSISLDWSGIVTPLNSGDYTYLRIRITYATNNLTTSKPNGYFNSGEVEDYRVPVSSYPLSALLSEFSAEQRNTGEVRLQWTVEDEASIDYYEVERSKDQQSWNYINRVMSSGSPVQKTYVLNDQRALDGISYYRLKFQKNTGGYLFSEVRKIESKSGHLSFTRFEINHTRDRINLSVNASEAGPGLVEVVSGSGIVLGSRSFTILPGHNQVEVPLKPVPAGWYVLRITSRQNGYSKMVLL